MIDDLNFTVTGGRSRGVGRWLDSHNCEYRYPGDYSAGEWVFRKVIDGWKEIFRCDCGKELDFTNPAVW